MANERYKKYLESREEHALSSRYTQEIAQDRRLSSLEKAGIGVGVLGLAVLGVRSKSGQKALTDVGRFLSKRTRPTMSRLERELIDSKYVRKRVFKDALNAASSTRGERLIKGFKDMGQESIALQLEAIEKGTREAFQSETATFFNKSVKQLQRGLEHVDLQGSGLDRTDFNKILEKTVLSDRARARQVFHENTQKFNEALKNKYVKKRSTSNLFGLRRMTVDDILSERVDFEFSEDLIHTLNLQKKPVLGERPQDDWLKNKLKNMVSKDESMKDLSLGSGLYINKQGEAVDLRFMGRVAEKTLDISKNIEMPVLQISPYRVLRVDELRERFGRTLSETIRKDSFQVPVSSSGSGFRTSKFLVRYGDEVFDAFDPLGGSQKGRFYTVRGIRNPTAKMYTKIINPEVSIDTPHKERGRLSRFFDIGSSDTPSVWGKIKSKFIKDDKRLRPKSYLNAYAEATTDNSLDRIHRQYRDLLNAKTTSFSDDVFKMFRKDINEIYGTNINLSSDDAVFNVFSKIATGNMPGSIVQSKIYKDEFTKLWYQYKSNPLAFRENKADSVRKLIHKEFMDQLYTQKNIDPFELIKSSKISSVSSKEMSDAEALIYSYTVDRIGADAGLGPSLIREMLFSNSKSSKKFKHIADRVHSKMDPAFSFKGLSGYEYPDREMFNESRRILVRKTIMPWEDGAGFFKQFFAGRKNPEYVTEATSAVFHVGVRLNEMLGQFGLGLSNESMGSSAQIFGNLFAKRILPFVVGKEALSYASWQTEKLTGTSLKAAGANIFANAQMGFSRWANESGFSDFANRAVDVMPGSEELLMLPLIESFDPTRSEQETWDRIHGEVPIRKGRWWTLGNTSFVGGRTEYFAPSSYRVAHASPLMTDVLYGSEEEYWANHWLPSLSYPLAPIRHFITDPYHYEDKHYDSRPYPLTGGFSEVNEIPVAGPIVDKAVSAVFKPQRYMHEDEWRYPQQVSASSGAGSEPSQVVTGYIPEGAVASSTHSGSGGHASTVAGTDEFGRPYTNPASAGSIIDQSWGQAKDVSGLYGFLLDSVLGEDQTSDYSNVIADSRGMTSQRRRFWDSDINGLDINPISPDLNEVSRRAIGKSEKWGQRFNPINNTMPIWMPGEENFIDFKTGDPYSKIKRGEQRLPGAGYEVLNDVPSSRLQMRSSQVGRDVQGMVDYFLKLDDDFSPWTESVLEEGTAIHRAVQAYWDQLGILHSIEVEVYDPKYDVTGHYDAIIKKQNAFGREYLELNDIKSMSDKRFRNALGSGKPYDDHREQVNYYMGVTGLKKGSLFYVNRDDPSQVQWFHFNFSKKMFNESRQKIETARAITNELIEKGVVSPWETYDEFHRFKILADVAPYSEQYDYYVEKMQESYWKEKYNDEIQKIKSQVSEKGKPHRFYGRSFGNADLQYEQVTIKKQIDRNTYLTNEHPHNPIKLAGLSVNNTTKESDDFLDEVFAPGTPITIGYSSDPLDKYADDSLKTIRAVAYYGHHSKRYKDELYNINKQLIQRGYARELDNDYSAAGVHARFTDGELNAGKVWEFFSHQDTPIHTKALQVRTPLESYKRRDLYGKCISPDTLIQTTQGLKEAQNVQVGDVVKTHTGKLTEVGQISINPISNVSKENKLYIISCGSLQHFPLKTTGEHPILVKKQEKCIKADKVEPEWVQANDIKAGDYVAYPRFKFSSAPERLIEIKQPAGINNHLAINESFYKLAGYWLARGSIFGNKNSIEGIDFSFNTSESERINEVQKILIEDYGIESCLDAGVPNCTVIRVKNKAIGSVFFSLFGGKKEKHINSELLQASKANLLSLAKAYFGGNSFSEDGVQEHIPSVTSERLTLLIQIRDILTGFGIVASIGKHEGDTNYELFVDDQGDAYTYFDNEYVYVKVLSIETKDYNGFVYDFGIDDNDHSFCTIGHAVHNSWQPWTLEDQVKPTAESLFAGHPIRSALVGGALTAMVWKPNRLKAGAVGAAFAAAMSLIRAINEAGSENKWIPERRVKEREIDEYFDRLTYVKNKGLYEAASRKIQEEEGYSVEAKIRYFENQRKESNKEIRDLEDQKKKLRIRQDVGLADKILNLFRKENLTYKDKIREINEEIKEISEEKKAIPIGEEELSDLGKKAVEYRERYLSTLYAVDPYGARDRIYKALPQKDRKYFDDFLDATPDEREEILKLIPKNQKRIYQALWDMERDESESMEKYFSQHYLPKSDWEGWLPDKSLDDIKIKVAKYENVDISEFGYWKTDELRSEANNSPLINIRDNNMKRSEIERELRTLLEGEGLEDIVFELTPAEYGVTIDLDLRKDKRKEIEEYLEANGLSSLL